MKRKVTVQLSEQVAEQLEAAAEQRGTSKAAIVESALERFLNPDAKPSTTPPCRVGSTG